VGGLDAKVEKRSKFQIYFDILDLLNNEVDEYDRVSPTRVAHRANLPYDRFQRALERLVQLGMVSYVGESLAVTEKGLEYVREFKRMNDFLKRMGLLS
jgi:predicted transcriptional regulator